LGRSLRATGWRTLPRPVQRETAVRLRDKPTAAGVELLEHGGVSMYFKDPDATRLELIADPLGEMYGSKVL
jgi:hypothetical protein